MKVFSLFSGIGGFDLALTRKGHSIVGACEIDSHARSIYRKHFPDVPLWEDAVKINPKELPDFEMLCAGFPCQAFSVSGKRLGFEESRGTVFFEIAKIAREKRPKLLFLENVPGILNHEEGRTFAQVLNTLHEMGYDFEWQTFDGKYFLPQDRERVFIIGHLGEEPRRKIFPIIEDGGPPTKDWTSVRTLTAGAHSGGLHSQMTMLYVSQKNANMKQRMQERDETWTLQANGTNFIVKDNGRWRRLTPLEWERLQGFPDDWTKGISDTQRFKCLGNAVMVSVVAYILSRLTLEVNNHG